MRRQTGVSWASDLSSDSPKTILIDSWKDPKTAIANNLKAPSEIICRTASPCSWGFDARRNRQEDPIRWFKLLLLEEQELHDSVRPDDIYQRSRQSLERLNKTAQDVVQEYLKSVWDFLTCIKSGFQGSGARGEALTQWRVQLISPRMTPYPLSHRVCLAETIATK